MELPVESSQTPSRRRNYEMPPWCYLLWGVPAVLAVAAIELGQPSIISPASSHAVSVVAVAWAGVGCYVNGRSCGRVHCRIDGILLPALSIIGTLNVVSIIPFDWNLFWLAFVIILASSFVPEITWKKYSQTWLGDC